MKVMVIDGNSILNRAFYGVRALTTRARIPNAVYGFLMIYLKLIEERKPDDVCVAFDLKARRSGIPNLKAIRRSARACRTSLPSRCRS